VRQLKATSYMNQTDDFISNGFAIIDNFYTEDEIDTLLQQIHHTNTDKDTFRKSGDLFAIRQFLKEVPSSLDTIFNDTLVLIIIFSTFISNSPG
jgi:hypothetical protein